MPEYRFEGETELGCKIIAGVREAAAEQPDRIYERIAVGIEGDVRDATCVYVWEGQPSCLIGQGLWRAEVIDASFTYQEWNIEGIGELILSEWWTARWPELSVREVAWLRWAQQTQDARRAWSVAVTDADEHDRRTYNVA